MLNAIKSALSRKPESVLPESVPAVVTMPVLKQPASQATSAKWKLHLHDEELVEVNAFADRIINHDHKYSKHSIATPKLVHLHWLYHKLVKAEEKREQGEEIPSQFKIFESDSNRRNDWGAYAMANNNPDFLQEHAERISILNVDTAGDGAMLGKKLVYVADYVVKKCHMSHYFPDIRYLLHLEKNPGDLDKIPAVLKNGKVNIFLGTVIMKLSKPHALATTWRGKNFETELVCLDTQLVGETIQFVMIKQQAQPE